MFITLTMKCFKNERTVMKNRTALDHVEFSTLKPILSFAN